MIQIIEENRKPSFGQKFSNAVGAGLQSGSQMMQQKSQKEAIKKLLGEDLSNASPEFQKLAYEYGLKGGLENKKQADKLREDVAPLQGAMDTLNRMKALRKKGKLGIGSTYSPFGETRKQAGEYEQLGKSLIQYATNIPIRNRIEFETLAENLYDPTTTDAKAEGILNAMERIITNSLQSAGGESVQNKSSNGSVGAQRKPISSFSIGAK